MANIDHGMNITEVEQLGHTMKQKGDDIQTLCSHLNTLLNNTSWVGPDATQFRNEWPNYQQQLTHIVNSLRSFGDKAITNAARQRDTSGTL